MIQIYYFRTRNDKNIKLWCSHEKTKLNEPGSKSGFIEFLKFKKIHNKGNINPQLKPIKIYQLLNLFQRFG